MLTRDKIRQAEENIDDLREKLRDVAKRIDDVQREFPASDEQLKLQAAEGCVSRAIDELVIGAAKLTNVVRMLDKKAGDR